MAEKTTTQGGVAGVASVHPLSLESPKQIRSSQSIQSNESKSNDSQDGPPIAVDDPDGIDTTNIQELPAWKKFLYSKWGCAFLLSTITIILLLWIRPAFFLKRRENTLDRPRIHWLYVFITWLVLFGAIVLVPVVINVCKKKWVGKT